MNRRERTLSLLAARNDLWAKLLENEQNRSYVAAGIGAAEEYANAS